jgi:large conductance mechanosensitive channel
MFKEFKEFISRGNVIDLAVAVIMGAAFTNIVQALVKDVITPILGIFLGGIDFSNLSITLGHAAIKYGSFIQAIINFLVIGFVVFIIVKAINKIESKIEHDLLKSEKENEEEKLLSPEVKELREIKNILKSNSLSQKMFK